MKAMHNYGCALSPKHIYHQALVKMSEFLLISWGFLIAGHEKRCDFKTSGMALLYKSVKI